MIVHSQDIGNPHPSQLHEGAFGIFRDDKAVKVKIHFDKVVQRYVYRTLWHPSQENEFVDDGVIVTMEVNGTTELINWVLEWAEHAVVLEPESLRTEITNKIKAMLVHYI